ncbi:ABC transporter ATP-binding protein YtrB [Rubripirellula lacrimiformis]|uniref:ABC transporter ATP-binding protein YtrB n=1 Tax=Rubripirellula lacrimiformis TaxID=1930273 RepID=A0A517NJ34_9BACT|nr:ABC transporter ATP-binding protein [Rubripirellula lacrimiformis]QDT07142.1 ABC transporter ATP-binding protein YtrB [Rubripirellula lacrimiformis]
MPPVISAKNLSMHFRRCDALRGVDMEIQPGTVFALLGENGAGKTTLIRILTGFQKPSSGTCLVSGVNPSTHPLKVRRSIGYVSDSPALYDWMTVAQIGGFAASFYDREFLTQYEESIRRYDIQPDQKVKHLSKGQRAKVALSLALSHDPDLLILDEPTSGLDPKVRRSFLESMIDRAATGRTVFLSSHQISEVERVADTIAILHQGKIVLHGSLAEIRETIWQVVVDVDDPLRALPILAAPAQILSEEASGGQRQMFVRYLKPEMIDELRATEGVVDVRHRVATLEEVFVACTSGDLPTQSAPSDQPATETKREAVL